MDLTPVTFFYPYPEEVKQVAALSFDDWRFWTTDTNAARRRAWILRTYLRLQRAGYEVRLRAQLPTEGVVVLLPEEEIRNAFRCQYNESHYNLLIVSVRADVIGFRWPLADVEIVQNGRFANKRRTFFIPHWPQPGLVPREVSRGAQVKNIVFKGGYGSLRAEFRSTRWYRFIERNGLTFSDDTAHHETTPQWHDYSKADLVLAVRPAYKDGGLRCEKPATKLINAWHAGVPALLGPEYAYRELRHSPLDYIEVDSVEEVIEQIKRLKTHPQCYQAMVERGKRRAEAFTPERITERWANVLFQHIPELVYQSELPAPHGWPLYVRSLANYADVPPSLFELRKLAGHTVRSMQHKVGRFLSQK